MLLIIVLSADLSADIRLYLELQDQINQLQEKYDIQEHDLDLTLAYKDDKEDLLKKNLEAIDLRLADRIVLHPKKVLKKGKKK